MANLDLTTSHNIVVRVELASTVRRILASVLDNLILFTYYLLIVFVFYNNGAEAISILLILPIMLCYDLIFEYYNNGQTLGKRVMRIRVISLSGERPPLNALVMRWMFRTIDILTTFGILAIVFISSTRKKQRIGDILGDTTVVRIQNENSVSLNSIKNIDLDNYAVSYPNVTQYNDEDMLLIKEVLKRVSKSPSEANRKILSELISKVCQDLQLKTHEGTRKDFLKVVLSDYVILTR